MPGWKYTGESRVLIRKYRMMKYTEGKNNHKLVRGKYHRLYSHLCGLSVSEWRTTFVEIESILGFKLPPSARRYRPWWANRSGSGYSHALAWTAAGWATAEVNLAAETLVLQRKAGTVTRHPILDTVWPVHSAGAWPETLGLRREDFYEDRT